MTKDDKDIVAALRFALAQRIGQDHVELWFGDGTQFAIGEGHVEVTVADAFKLERIRRYHEPLTAAAVATLGQPCDVVLRVAAGLSDDVAPVKSPVKSQEKSQADGQPASPASPTTSPTVAVAASDTGRAPRKPLASLQRFAVGEGNRVAHAAALSTAQRLGAFSPLFLYGPSGSGKTHLLEGILQSVRRQRPRCRCLCLSAEQFTTQFLGALHGSGLPSFRRKYRGLDLLLIDDVHFFAGKRATLVEVQYTLDSLLREGRQLVLAADRPPSEMGRLGPELTTRMAGGLVCGMETADQPTRLGILQRIAANRRTTFPAAVLELLATSLPGDARQLMGAVNRLEAVSLALEQPVTVEFARRNLEDILRATQRVLRLHDIDHAVCEVFGLAPKSLQSARKGKALSHPRMLAMWLARKYTRAALAEIGDYFGRRSHSTVISAQKKVNTWMQQGAAIQLAHGDASVEDALRRVEHRLRTA